MRRSILNGSALCANASKLPKHAQSCAIVLSLSRELSRTPLPARRSYASASPKPQRQQQQQQPQPSTTTAATATSHPSIASTRAAATPSPSAAAAAAANPPPTTRPPQLTLPARPANPDTSDAKPGLLSKQTFSHLFASGMAYLKFYKTGIKHVYTNTRLLYSSSQDILADKPDPSTRAHLHLRLRWQHDVRRLPLFALVLLVCGEFTPFVVLALPGAVPLPCRIPRQVEKLLGKAERGRAEARGEIAGAALDRVKAGTAGEAAPPVGVLARILGVSSHAWTPGFLLASRVERRLRFLAVDDALLVRSGGAEALVEEEVRLACADRGVDVLGRGERELRSVLGRWLRLTDARRLGEEGREKTVTRLLLAKDSEWGA